MPKFSSNINLEKLHKLCKGDENKEFKYLNQFVEMIPMSLQKLKIASEEEDRNLILQELHFMSPQLLFFGIDDIDVLMEEDKNNKVLSFNSLKNQLEAGIINIEKAIAEVRILIDKNTNNPFNET